MSRNRFMLWLVLGVLFTPGFANAYHDTLPHCDLERAPVLVMDKVRKGIHGGVHCSINGPRRATAHEQALYRVVLGTTTALEVNVTAGDFPPSLTLYDAQGHRLASQSWKWQFVGHVNTTTLQIPVTLQPGTYYVAVERGRVYPNFESKVKGNSFEIGLKRLPLSVAPNDGGRCRSSESRKRPTKLLPNGATFRGQISAADCFLNQGYWQIYDLTVATRRTIKIETSSDVTIWFYDASGIMYDQKEFLDSSDTSKVVEVPAGQYEVWVGMPGGWRGDFRQGNYQISVDTVGTPSTNTSLAGAVCQEEFETLEFDNSFTMVEAVITERSCAEEKTRFHLYSFSVTEPRRMLLWRTDYIGGLSLGATGPQGRIPFLESSERKIYDHVLQPGTYHMSVGLGPYDSGQTRTGRIRLPMIVGALELAGEKGEDCQQHDIRPLVLGQAIEGRMHAGSCIVREQQSANPAELFQLTLDRPRKLLLTLDADGFQPVLVAVTPQGPVNGQPESGPGRRELKVDLPVGQHLFAIFTTSDQPGNYRLKVSER